MNFKLVMSYLKIHSETKLLKSQRICLQFGRPGFDPWVGKIIWRMAQKTTPIFMPGESPWTEDPGRLESMGSQRVGHD